MMRASRFLCFVAGVVAAPILCRAELVDNPLYKSWSKFKPGTSIELKSESDVGGTKTESAVMSKLVSVDAEKVMLEVKMFVVISGVKTAMPARKVEYLAKAEKVDEPTTQENPKDKPKDKPKIVKEDVEIAGKAYPCEVVASSVVQNGIKLETKTWTCEEIPGGVAKRQTEIPEGPMKGTTTETVTAITTK